MSQPDRLVEKEGRLRADPLLGVGQQLEVDERSSDQTPCQDHARQSEATGAGLCLAARA